MSSRDDDFQRGNYLLKYSRELQSLSSPHVRILLHLRWIAVVVSKGHGGMVLEVEIIAVFTLIETTCVFHLSWFRFQPTGRWSTEEQFNLKFFCKKSLAWRFCCRKYYMPKFRINDSSTRNSGVSSHVTFHHGNNMILLIFPSPNLSPINF